MQRKRRVGVAVTYENALSLRSFETKTMHREQFKRIDFTISLRRRLDVFQMSIEKIKRERNKKLNPMHAYVDDIINKTIPVMILC